MKLMIPKFWRHKNILSLLLYPFSLIYVTISCFFRHIQGKTKYFPKAKVIKVGNITVGGAGKTPTAIALAKMLTEHKIAFLSRGYKGSLKGPVMVRNSHNSYEVGDEPLLLCKVAPTCVAKNRLKGIKFLESLGYEIIITDDGLQDNRFVSHLNILVIDSSFAFGNKMVFPAGPLRESIESGEKNADFAILIGEDEVKINLPKFRAKFNCNKSLQGAKYVAFAGIGNPDKFFHTIKQAGGEIIKEIAFPDHYQYTEQDLENLLSFGWQLITTEKDFVRINSKYKNKIEILPVELVFENQKALSKLLQL